jgi:plastocyanin
MKRGIVSAVLFTLAVLAASPTSAAGIIVTEDGISDGALTVSTGEVISWIDVTGKATRIVFPDVQGAPVLKEFVGREVHVYFDRPGKYRYALTLGTKQGTREVAGEITVR